MLSLLLEHSAVDGEALGERKSSICDSLRLLFDVRDLHLPALQDPMQNTYRDWVVSIQQKVPGRKLTLNAVVGLVPLANNAMFLVHMKDREGPRFVFMQCDGIAMRSRPFLR